MDHGRDQWIAIFSQSALGYGDENSLAIATSMQKEANITSNVKPNHHLTLSTVLGYGHRL
jgi:hypothetical protein